MPCGCKVERTTEKRVILRNPKTGKKITEFLIKRAITSTIPKMNLLPGMRKIREETVRKYLRPSGRRLKI
tara:strand:+ start:898 stop:1107 length:210 start_codon:yes stop_codon:yes gene_type:complete